LIESRDTACHDAVTELLPWYVNGTLDESERDRVREHIGTCDDCRDNVELLSRVQHAVRTESPAPLVPSPRTEALLAALDARAAGHVVRNRWRWLAAASVIAVIGVTSLLTWPRSSGTDSPTRFETATSPAAVESINYVVELQFVDGTSAQARAAVFDAIDAGEPVSPVNESTYRVTLALGPLSLTDLERRIQEIESHADISTAEVVAVQLPME
jgi:anti-sigma factor RsiW